MARLRPERRRQGRRQALQAPRPRQGHQLAKKANADTATLDTAAGVVTLSHPDATAADGKPDGGHKVRYAGGLAGGRDLSEGFTVGGVEEDVTLPSPADSPSYPLRADLPAGVTLVANGAQVDVVDAAHTVVAALGDGIAHDSTPTPGGTGIETPTIVRVVAQEGRTATLSVGVDPAWFADPARRFPVVIDPYYNTGTAGYDQCPAGSDPHNHTFLTCDTYVNSDNPYASPGYSSQTELRTGSPGGTEGYSCCYAHNRTRSYLKFATDNYGSPPFNTYTVESANLSLYTWGGTATYADTSLFGAADEPTSYTNWANQPGGDTQDTNALATSYSYGGQGVVNLSGTGLTNLVQSWFANGDTNLGFRLQSTNAEDDTFAFRRYYSGEAGVGTSGPGLQITYVVPPPAPVSLSLGTTGPGNTGGGASWAPASDPNCVDANNNTIPGCAPDSYRLTLFDNGAQVSAPITVSGTANTFYGLAPGDAYQFSVAAHNANGWGPASFSPAWPSGITTQAGNGSLTVGWNASAPGTGALDHYVVYLYTTSGYTGSEVTVAAGAPRTATFSGLAPGTTYRVYVLASTTQNGAYFAQAYDLSGDVVAGVAPLLTKTVSSLATNPAYANAVEADGPSAWWRLDEAPGAGVAADASGTNSPATYQGGVGLGRAGALANDGDPAAALDGTSGYVGVPAGAVTDLSGGLSLEAWVNPSAVGSFQKVFDLGNGAANDNVVLGRYGSSNDVQFQVFHGSTSVGAIYASGALVANTWQHLVATLSPSGAMALYRNGVYVAAGTATSVPTTVARTQAYVGRSSWGDAHYAGGIDEVAIYHRALTAAQVGAHWQASGAGAPAPAPAGGTYASVVRADGPLGWWRLGEAQGAATATDASGNNRPCTHAGGGFTQATGALAADPDPAAGLNGVSSALTCGTGPDISGTGPFTYETWVRTTTPNTTLMAQRDASGYQGEAKLTITGPGAIEWFTYNNGYGFYTDAPLPGASFNVTDGAWHHIVATREADGSANVYVDGALAETAAAQASVALSTSLGTVLGADKLNNNQYLPGALDEVAIYPGALSAHQVRAHYLAAQTFSRGQPLTYTITAANPAGQLTPPPWPTR